MLSVLTREITDFSELTLLRTNINKIYNELKDSNYDAVIQTCDTSITNCIRIKEKAVKMGYEEIANSMFVISEYCGMMKNYSIYWKTLLEGRYKDSWNVLQDTIDRLINVTKFTKCHSDFAINAFNSHLQELEKLYPYRVFASSEMVRKTEECSICGKSVLDVDCIHIPGNLYWGQMAVSICKDIVFQAVALVKHPMDKRCIIEISDDNRTEKEKFNLLNYFVENNTNPLLLFSVIDIDKYYYNEKYDNVKRNDLCPCDSGTKFKYCCGASKYEKGTHYHIKLKDEVKLRTIHLS
ncbi:SEC-C domain-containing protein [Sporosarcina luteola]|uniref:YecA family protein n=1 Tax=Sporosarcina luteola TaxID=582850 RepID=UPI00203B07EA|nr:SEC-C domain-containing protein [Sporosarcina luteola]MCM3743879.1 SEC-C domain-containing protein [Sporosarcina luteola]